MNLENFENDYTCRFLSEVEFTKKMLSHNIIMKVFFDEIHALYLMHSKEILNDIIQFETRKHILKNIQTCF